MAKRKKITVTWWKKKTWKTFSQFIRLRDAIATTQGPHTVKCCSCGKPYPAFGIGCAQAGHFVPGRRNTILFDERCVNAQCYNCNVTLKGNWPGYYVFMLEKYDLETIDELLILAKQIRKFTTDELDELNQHYIDEIEALKNRPKVNILERRKVAIPPQERKVEE
jgi:hypothetical protein